jgi:hypothetical protein
MRHRVALHDEPMGTTAVSIRVLRVQHRETANVEVDEEVAVERDVSDALAERAATWA